MSGESDLINLYSQRILALAAALPKPARLEAPDASVMRRSPLCGSTVTVDVKVSDGVITDFAQDVKACALGQAAASVVGSVIEGQDAATVRRGRDELLAMLKSGGPAPSAPFEGLEVLMPAKDYKNRHASILLSLEATLEAMETARNSDCA